MTNFPIVSDAQEKLRRALERRNRPAPTDPFADPRSPRAGGFEGSPVLPTPAPRQDPFRMHNTRDTPAVVSNPAPRRLALETQRGTGRGVVASRVRSEVKGAFGDIGEGLGVVARGIGDFVGPTLQSLKPNPEIVEAVAAVTPSIAESVEDTPLAQNLEFLRMASKVGGTMLSADQRRLLSDLTAGQAGGEKLDHKELLQAFAEGLISEIGREEFDARVNALTDQLNLLPFQQGLNELAVDLTNFAPGVGFVGLGGRVTRVAGSETVQQAASAARKAARDKGLEAAERARGLLRPPPTLADDVVPPQNIAGAIAEAQATVPGAAQARRAGGEVLENVNAASIENRAGQLVDVPRGAAEVPGATYKGPQPGVSNRERRLLQDSVRAVDNPETLRLINEQPLGARMLKPIATGQDALRARLDLEVRLGRLDEDVAGAADEWFGMLPSDLLDDLGSSYVDELGDISKGKATLGQYDPSSGPGSPALINIVKGFANNAEDGDRIIVHEVTHHLEQFVPSGDARKLVSQWRREMSSKGESIIDEVNKLRKLGRPLTDAERAKIRAAYRYEGGFQEWFAEVITDKALRDIYMEVPVYRNIIEKVMAKVKAIATATRDFVARGGRRDQSDRVYKNLIDGNYPASGRRKMYYDDDLNLLGDATTPPPGAGAGIPEVWKPRGGDRVPEVDEVIRIGEDTAAGHIAHTPPSAWEESRANIPPKGTRITVTKRNGAFLEGVDDAGNTVLVDGQMVDVQFDPPAAVTPPPAAAAPTPPRQIGSQPPPAAAATPPGGGALPDWAKPDFNAPDDASRADATAARAIWDVTTPGAKPPTIAAAERARGQMGSMLSSYPDVPPLLARRGEVEAFLVTQGRGDILMAQEEVKAARKFWEGPYGGRGNTPQWERVILNAEEAVRRAGGTIDNIPTATAKATPPPSTANQRIAAKRAGGKPPAPTASALPRKGGMVDVTPSDISRENGLISVGMDTTRSGEQVTIRIPGGAAPDDFEDVSAVLQGTKHGGDTVVFVETRADGIPNRTFDQAHIRQVVNSSSTTPPTVPPRKPPTAEGVPSVPGDDEFAGNIRLSKFPVEDRPLLSEYAIRNPEEIEAARRGVIPDAEVAERARALVEEVGGDFGKLQKSWKPGEAWNAEEIVALRGVLHDQTVKVQDAAIAWNKSNSSEHLGLFALEMEKQADLQRMVSGVAAESGRAQRALQQDVLIGLGANDATIALTKLLKRLGVKKSDMEEVADLLRGIDLTDASAVNKILRELTKPQGIAKWRDRLYELWLNGILSGPKTHIINTVSNAVNAVLSPLESLGAAGIESVLAPFQGRARDRFFSEAGANVFGATQGVKEGFRAALSTLRHGISPEQATRLEYRPKAWDGKLGSIINFPSRALEAGDAFFKAINYRAELSGLAVRTVKKEGLKGDAATARLADLLNNPPKGMVDQAAKTAEYRLFRQDPGKGIAAVMNLREEWPIVRFVIPFLRTPTNLLKFGLERSALGLFNPSLARNMIRKNPEAADQISRAMLGSMATAGVAMMYAEGKITGRAPEGKAERADFYDQGKQAFSFKVGDHWISYNRLEPFNQVFSQVASFGDAITKGEDEDSIIDKAQTAAATMGESITNQTFLRGLNDALEAMMNPEQSFGNYARRLTASFIPFSSLLRTGAQMDDPMFKDPEGLKETVMASIPGLSRLVPNRQDALGGESERPGKVWFPIQFSKEQQSAMSAELNKYDIHVGFAGTTITGSGGLGSITLPRELQRDYQEQSGLAIKEALVSLMEFPGYKDATDQQKADAIESTIRNVRRFVLDTVIRPQADELLRGQQGIGGAPAQAAPTATPTTAPAAAPTAAPTAVPQGSDANQRIQRRLEAAGAR